MSATLFPLPQTGETSDDYYTPKWIFDALKITFDLDVACGVNGPAHTPCSKFYTQETDGLKSVWEGNVFMNPPFSKTNLWAIKFANHKNGIALVPVSKSKWFDNLWKDADAVTMLPYNLRFENYKRGNIFIACALFAYGSNNVKALQKSQIGRVRQ